ncbi:MAG: DUF1761 domain-containing protein [Chitinophagales bacterium]
MFSSFLSQANWWAIIVSALVYFVLGSVWFSALFGKLWMAEIARHGITIKEPEKKQIGMKMVRTFIYNLVAAFAIAYLIYISGSYRWLAGLKMGVLCGFGIASMGICIAYTWESRSTKLVMIDCGYAIVGMTICGAILAAWH